MNVRINGDTVIRLLVRRYAAQPAPECGNTLGIDDLAFKKRHTYETVIMGETTHKSIAVLDGRDGTSLKKWPEQNKHVTAVTRDWEIPATNAIAIEGDPHLRRVMPGWKAKVKELTPPLIWKVKCFQILYPISKRIK